MARSFEISKKLVWQAYKRVKANKGAEGIDGQTMENFEQNLKGNLYRIWTRMTSGSYKPPAVMAVTIPKRAGGSRVLGIPTISDRIAQTVVKMYFEPKLEPSFHEDSYGLHYVFDKWMAVHEPKLLFARYADDAVVHCPTLGEAERLQVVLEQRFQECHLELHPEKSKVVCCKGECTLGRLSGNKFEFLGYEFRLRTAVNRQGRKYVRFLPAISPMAAKSIRREIRSWKLQNRSDKSLDDLSRMFSAKLRGWINYYGHFYKSALYPTFYNLNRKLVKWATREFKKLRRRPRRAHYWLGGVAKRQPNLFAHWQVLGLKPAIGITGAG